MPFDRPEEPWEEGQILLESWRAMETSRGARHLIGRRLSTGSSCVSTAIKNYDFEDGKFQVTSCRVYQLVGCPDYDVEVQLTWRRWVLQNRVNSFADVTHRFVDRLRSAGFDCSTQGLFPPRPFDPPLSDLEEVPADFPEFIRPMGWHLGKPVDGNDSYAAPLQSANFCEGQARTIAKDLVNRGWAAAKNNAALAQVYDMWNDGLLITENEARWLTRRAATLLGWECPDSVFHDPEDKDE